MAAYGNNIFKILFAFIVILLLLLVPVYLVDMSTIFKANPDKEVYIPILMYHSLDDSDSISSTSISPQRFEKDMNFILESGYTPITVKEFTEYWDGGASIPEKPIMVTFDDGYMNNYTLAYPILKKLNVKATIFTIGWSIGRDTFPDGRPINSHFTGVQGREMLESGLIDLQSHTFDLHSPEGLSYYEEIPCGLGVSSYPGEEKESYRERLKKDFSDMNEKMLLEFGIQPTALAYPYGEWTKRSEETARDFGIKTTFLAAPGDSFNVKSPYLVHRIGINGETNLQNVLWEK